MNVILIEVLFCRSCSPKLVLTGSLQAGFDVGRTLGDLIKRMKRNRTSSAACV